MTARNNCGACLLALDPVQLLESRSAKLSEGLAQMEVGGRSEQSVADTSPGLSRFVESLSTAWRDGEVRPTHRKRSSGPRTWRTRLDPFEKVWPLMEQWLNEKPDTTAKESISPSPGT